MSILPALNDIKKGLVLKVDNEPYQVIEASFMRTAQRKPVMQTKLKNLISNRMLERSFAPGEKVETADLEKQQADFLYKDQNKSYFMNNQNYEQWELPLEQIGDKINYFKEGMKIDLLCFEGRLIGFDLPKKIELKVTSAPPGVKGNSAQGSATKQATLETGIVVNVPLFIKNGDVIRINTETGEYVERA